MSPVILVGVVAINLALIAYTAGIVAVRRRRRAGPLVLGGLAVAVALDLIATGCMVAGSSRSWLTPHGVAGYLALLVMVAAVARLWGFSRGRPDVEIPVRLRNFLGVGYVVWLIAYAIGVALAAMR